MKNKGLVITGIILCVIIVVGLVILLIQLLNGNFKFNFNFGSESTNLVIDQEYDQAFMNIDISGEAANIKILNSDTNKARVVIYGEEDRNTVTVDGDTLKIVSKGKKCKFFCFNNRVARVEVYLPLSLESAFGNVKIDSKYGDITIENFNNYIFDLDLNYGDIEIDRCGVLKVDSNYGDITVDEINGYFEIEADYGDIKINKININKDSRIEDDFGDVRIGSTNDIYIDAKTSFGDVDINNNNRSSEYTLKINNSFGDIKIDN